jgi:uncharacterized Zn-binding protein involved in type VI secretion
MGKQVIRKGSDLSTGHPPGYPATKPIEGSNNVKVNGMPVVREGDKYKVHCFSDSCHQGSAKSTSKGVYVNGKLIHTSGDGITCKDFAGSGSDNVFAG